MRQFFAALNRLEKLTPLRFSKLLKYFENDAERIWKAGRERWQAAGIEPKAVNDIWPEKEKIDPAEELEKLAKLDAKVLAITDEKYPQLLKEIYDPPPVLLYRGEFPLPADDFAVAIVGSRVTSSYGRQATCELTRGLVQAGVSIISGLAIGIDTVAHQTALDCGGRTVAVLGNGIDQIYPPRNHRLAEDILSKDGAIISEYPIGMEPAAYNFPPRNRIIAGLARGILVTEARERSGALITTQIGLESGREIFAVPGSIFAESSAGPNRLIQLGAKPVSTEADLLEALSFYDLPEKIQVRAVVADTAEEAKMLEVLTKTATHIDELVRQSSLNAGEASSVLSLLEMKGLAKNLGGMQWVRT